MVVVAEHGDGGDGEPAEEIGHAFERVAFARDVVAGEEHDVGAGGVEGFDGG